MIVNSFINADEGTWAQKLSGSLLPQVAIMQGSLVFAQYEGSGLGINSQTAQVDYHNFSFNAGLYMLLLDFFLYFFLGLYLDKVIPSTYGQHLSPFFCC